MPPAENMPDFDKMSPEEIMAWMETLAKRQGANTDELTTSADVEIAEIDPDTVVIDEPGYVPYGEERPPKAEPAAPPARPPAAPPPAPEPARPAAAAPPPRQPAAPPAPPMRQPAAPPPQAEPARPAASMPIAEPTLPSAPQQPAATAKPAPEPLPLPAMDEAEEDAFETKITATGSADAMAWLESLAADSGDSLLNFDNLDFSALSDELETVTDAPPVESNVSPIDFLDSLTSSQGEIAAPPAAQQPEPESPWHAPEPEATPEAEAITDPFASGVDPMAWLEELARRQGAKSEELTTSTRMNIPVPENAVVDEPGYKPYSPDAPFESRKPAREPEPEPLQLENPADWLGSLAEAQGFDETAIGAKPEPASMNVEDIERAIGAGTVSPEQMQYYLEHQTDRYIDTIGDAEDVEEEEAPPVPAELPDWLLEQVGAPPVSAENAPAVSPALVDDIQEPPAVADMPDWLKEDVGQDGGLDFNIFADSVEAAPAAPPAPHAQEPDILVEPFAFASNIEVDPNDPWVEAFDIEHEQGAVDITTVPDWYTANLSDPKRIAAVQAIERGELEDLDDAPLPAESELPAGEPTEVPDWLAESVPVAPAEETPAVSEIPDWLREMEVEVEPQAVPDWLMEEPAPIVVEETPDWLMEEPAAVGETPDWLAEFAPEVQQPAPVIVSTPPAPKPVTSPLPPLPVNVSATLDNARSLSKAGSVAESLAEYESLIRQNRELQFVVDDLTSLVKVQKDNPAVFRVLGDGLMRQGKLQAALDVYREALNQL